MKENGHVRIFFEENSRKVFSYIMKMTGNRDDAEDCFQDCFIRYTEKYPDRFSLPLLYTVAKTVCIDSFRKNSRYGHEEIEQADTAQGPEDAAISRQKVSRVEKVLESLPADERELIAMAGRNGLKYDEIAEITGLSVANIKVKLHRTRLKIKKLLGDAAYE